jgi:putative transposase
MKNEYPQRRSVRLRGFDYASSGAYFITICAHHREQKFGRIENGLVRLNDLGRLTEKLWHEIPNHFPSVFLDTFIVMPDHLHGILLIDNWRTGTACRAPTPESYQAPASGSISTVIRSFKSAVTRNARAQNDHVHEYEVMFQRGFFETVVTSRSQHQQIRDYILSNPTRWSEKLRLLGVNSRTMPR